MAITKKGSKIQKFCVLQVISFSLIFVRTVFVSSLLDLPSASASIISSHLQWVGA